MAIYKRGEIYWYEFEFNGERIRESTKQGNDKVARQMESAHRTSLAKGEVGIRDTVAAPVLKTFLEKEFVPYVEATAKKPNTVISYKAGVRYLVGDAIGNLRLDEVTNQHVAQFIARQKPLAASTINGAVRSLRRALYLAEEWGKLKAAPRVKLAKGEVERDQICTPEDRKKYLNVVAQPCHDIMLLSFETGMRPGEVLALTWDRVALAERVIEVDEGKTDNAERVLGISDALHEALSVRWQTAGKPTSGWVFPSPYLAGKHVGMPYRAHYDALKKSGVANFVPYIARHTALTELAQVCDQFTLKTIAGHSSIVTTQRYVHTQKASILAAFERRDSPQNPPQLEVVPSKRRASSTKTAA